MQSSILEATNVFTTGEVERIIVILKKELREVSIGEPTPNDDAPVAEPIKEYQYSVDMYDPFDHFRFDF